MAASQRGAAGGARPAGEGRARAARVPAPRGLSRARSFTAAVRGARHNGWAMAVIRPLRPLRGAGEQVRQARWSSRACEDLVVITGFSGAGKSTAMNVFEDAGYFCVDNLPPEMIRSLVELFVHKGSKVERAAVVSDVRGGVYFEALRAVVDDLDALGLTHHVLFLEAAEQTLVTRYKETRRRHPLAPEGSVAAGVAAERALLEPLRGRADLVIDTTGMSAAMLREKIADEFLPRKTRRAAGADVHELRLQARPAARGGPGVRRALPGQPALRAGAARADRPRRARGRVHRARRAAGGALRAPARAARLPAAAVRRRGQGAPGDRDRLHRRAPPLGGDRRAPRRALPRARGPRRRGRPPRHRQARRAAPERRAASASAPTW